jgi:sporulation protein YlmC with PRC-barrel domain
MERVVKIVHIIVVTAFALGVPAASNAQVAGSTFLGASYAELRDVAVGWSAKRQILGRQVYNKMDERIGSVDDIIVATDKAVSYAIVNAGGFLAVAKHNVAIPVSQFQLNGDKLVLPGATRDSLKAAPEFEYAN